MSGVSELQCLLWLDFHHVYGLFPLCAQGQKTIAKIAYSEKSSSLAEISFSFVQISSKCGNILLKKKHCVSFKDSLIMNLVSLLYLGPFQILHASDQKITALLSILLREILEMTDVSTGYKIKTVHRGALLLQGLHKERDVFVSDHLVCSGVQGEMGPGGWSLSHSVVMVFVDVLGQGVQHDSQQENSHSEKC